MNFRVSRAVFASLSLSVFCLPAFAQTTPKNKVPAETPADAKSLVATLLTQGKIIRSSQIQRGMRGVARSVFQGTKIEEFPVVALGRLERVNGGGDIVLIRVLGGPVVKRNSGIIAGMSGSPVYFNGKMLGAIAFGWGFPKEPIGGVTPITSMIETSLPDARPPQSAQGRVAQKRGLKTIARATKAGAKTGAIEYRPAQALRVAGREIEKVVVSRDHKRLALAGSTMTLRPVSTLLQLSGYSEKSLPRLRKALEPYQIEPVIGPSSKKTGVNPPFIEGGAIGVQLVSGDMDQTAIGTITFRHGNRILAFGHPMFGLGAASLPMTTAYVHDIFPSYERSFKFGSPVKAVGTLQQDTPFAIGGTIGAQADMIPMTVTLRDDERNIKRTIRVRVMKDPMLTPQLILSTAGEAIESVLGQPSDKMVRVGLNLEIQKASPIKRRNYIYSSAPISNAAMVDLAQTLSLTQRNEFARGDIKRVDLSVSVEPKRKTARLKQLIANRNKVKPGDTVQISAVFEPTDAPGTTFSHTFDFKVPDDAPAGVMRVAAGPATEFWPLQVRSGGAPPNPTTLPELVTAFRQVGAFNELVVMASTPRTFLQLDQQKLPSPPPSWSRLMRSSQSSAIGSYNEVEERRELLDWVILGSQLLAIPVENPDQRTPARTLPGTTPGATRPITDTNTPGPRPVAPGDGDDMALEESALYSTAPSTFPTLFAVPSNSRFDGWTDAAPFLQQIKVLQHLATQERLQDKPQDKPQEKPKDPKDITVPPPPGSGATIAPPETPKTPAPAATPTPRPTPVPTPMPDPKTIGRPAQSWVQDGGEDFLGGRFDRTLLTSDGQIRLAPTSKTLTNTADPFVWSVAGDASGNVFLGTGSTARIWKVDAAGNRTLFFSSDDVAVTALTTDSAGNLYAALTPGGRLLRLSSTGTPTTIFRAGQDYIWALEWDAQKRLLVGSGGSQGKIFRLNDATTRAQSRIEDEKPLAEGGSLLASVPQKHIRALSVRGSDIFAGTGGGAPTGSGVLLRVDGGSGATQALAEAPPGTLLTDSEVLAVAAAPEGIYFGTSGNGTIYRWTPTGGTEALYPSPQQAVYALRRTGDGGILAGTGNKGVVYLLMPGQNANDSIAARLLEPDQQQALAVALAPNDDLLIGTGNSGAAYRLSLSDRTGGIYTSSVLDAKNLVRWGAVRYTGRGVTLETRSGNTNDPDKTWSPWQSALINDLGEWRVGSPDARFLQYRVRLNPQEKTPALVRVEILYRSKNSPPVVTLSAPVGGEFWRSKKKLTWSGKDPDTDTLRYRASISSDEGTTWKPLELTSPETASFELDTSKWPDGAYVVRVEGDDAVRNPEDPQSDQSVSLPFTIDNALPRIEITVRRENGQLLLTGTAQDTLSPIAGAEWRLLPATPEKSDGKDSDGKDSAKSDTKTTTTPEDSKLPTRAKEDAWQAVAPADGLFDSRRENLTAILDVLTLKEQTTPRKIEVRTEDAAGNSVKVELALPM